MQEPQIDPKALEIWADYLISHSLGGVTADDRVMIKGERIGWPLMEVLERKVIEAGAVPDVYLVPPNNDRGRVWSSAMGRHGNLSQVAAIPAWHGARYDSMTKYIEVLGAEDPPRFAGLSAEQIGRVASADRPFTNVRLGKPWVVTLYPTPASAAMEGMTLDDYVNFIVGASTTDPRPLLAAERTLAPLIERGREMEIVTVHPEDGRALTLKLSLAHSLPVLSYGLRNFPDGEIFTSPDASSVEGEIFLDLTVHHGGTDIRGIHLKLEGGRIVNYSAMDGMKQLTAIIETDEGSHRLGEVALGMNPGLAHVLKHPLFVEKVGGTLHIAIGASYENGYVEDPSTEVSQAHLKDLEAKGILNRSAQHVDIVADFREGGCGRSVRIDGRPLRVENNLWVPGVGEFGGSSSA